MTEKNSPENRNRLSGDFQTASSERRGVRKKTGRVSQRRELAIVTLGAVAAITGLGGILAANPPGWAVSDTNARPSVTAQAATPLAQSAAARDSAGRPSSNTDDTSASERSDTGQDEAAQASAQQPASQQAARREARRAARRDLRQSAPVYSAPTPAPSAVSQGS